MRKTFDKKTVFLAGAALALTATLTVESAMAYFTTYSTARGSVQLNIGFTETEVREEVDRDGKHVRIANVGDYDCFVRVRIFSDIEEQYTPSEGWQNAGDGYWYYTPVLGVGEETPELLVTYEWPVNTEEDRTEEFNIIVIQECTPVVYENDTAVADWSNVIIDDGTE